jgi:hypothetical protein
MRPFPNSNSERETRKKRKRKKKETRKKKEKGKREKKGELVFSKNGKKAHSPKVVYVNTKRLSKGKKKP